MSLDWTLQRPCKAVGAPKMAERGRDALSAYGERVKGKMPEKTAEEIADDIGKRYDCDNCPVVAEMNAELKDMGLPEIARTPFTSPCEIAGIPYKSGKLPFKLAEEAFGDMNPDEMKDYANRLEPFAGEDPELKQAIWWLRFWGAKGIGMSGWW